MAGYTKGPWRLGADLSRVHPVRQDGSDFYRNGYVKTIATVIGSDKDWRDIAEAVGDGQLIAVSTIIHDLYASEINARIEWFWDGGFTVAIGDDLNGWRETASIDEWVDALRWLESAACRHFPESDFALTRATPKDSADA